MSLVTGSDSRAAMRNPRASSAPPAPEAASAWQVELREAVRAAKQGDLFVPKDAPESVDITRERSRFPMLVPGNYAKLIDWSNPADPLRRLVTPSAAETDSDGKLDSSGEETSTVVRGLQHKYAQTGVIIVNQACAAHCRYCFRRRLMSVDVMTRESIADLEPALIYLRNQTEIDNVVLSGGDPLVSGTIRLRRLMTALAAIPHLRLLRISTKIPAFLPSRIAQDPALLELLSELSQKTNILVHCHFDHPREISPSTTEALTQLRRSGVMLSSQIALMRGVNDDHQVLRKLFTELHARGVTPHYLFHPRPVRHATHFQLPILEGMALIERLRDQCSGPVKHFRYVMVVPDGKLELIGIDKRGPKPTLVAKWQQIRRGLTKPKLGFQTLSKETMWWDGAPDTS